MNKWKIYIPIGMSSHNSNSVFPITGARFAVEKQKMHNGKSDEKTVSKDKEKMK